MNESLGKASEILSLVSGVSSNFEDTLERIARIRSCASRLGIPVRSSSRVDRLERQLEKFVRVQQSDLRRLGFDWVTFTESMRDVHELDFICRVLQDKEGEQIRQLLRDSLAGAVLPHQDRNHLARNTQFQLYVAALFEYSGLLVRLAEPDIIFRCAGFEYTFRVTFSHV